jgi:hypothetical protein
MVACSLWIPNFFEQKASFKITLVYGSGSKDSWTCFLINNVTISGDKEELKYMYIKESNTLAFSCRILNFEVRVIVVWPGQNDDYYKWKNIL